MDSDGESPPGLPQKVNSLSLSSSSPTLASRTGASGESDSSSSSNVHRASLSMPPPAKPTTARQNHVQLSNKPSDISQRQSQEPSQPVMTTSPIPRDPDQTPKLETSQKLAVAMPFMLPEAALRQPTTVEPETESNRMSFSSLYSFGSAIMTSARGIAGSGPSSFAGSEPDCMC